jgi:heptosyltransferase II
MDPDRIRRILIRGTNWVGDAIMTTPAIAGIRAVFPRSYITILVVPWVADVFAFSPHIDEVIQYRKDGRHKRLKGKFTLINELKNMKFDLALLLQNAFEAAFITWCAGIPHRAGYDTDGRRLLLTHPVKMKREYKHIHETQYYLTMLRCLGFEVDDLPLCFNVPGEFLKHVRQTIAEVGPSEGPLIIIAPGATYGSAKMWGAQRYGQLARKLVHETGSRLVILGSSKEHAIGDAIISETGSISHRNLCGATDLMGAAAWIQEADLIISNDSGLMHVAASLQKPQVAIFGPTNSITTGPKNPRARLIGHEISCSPCLRTTCPTDHRCMSQISVEEVFTVALSVMKEFH